MSQKFVLNASVFEILSKIDAELAGNLLKTGCPYCGGKLHQANYPRSLFGLALPFRVYCEERLSFCCSSCRKRTTPPSVRFFGRRWYVAPIFILLSILMLGINERRLVQIKKHFGLTVSESTWKRWRAWWRDQFIETPFWLPRALYRLFTGSLIEKIPKLLQFLSPLTGGNLRAV